MQKTFVVTGLTFATLMFPAAIAPDLRVSIGLLVGAYIALGLFSSNHWAITQTLAGPLAAGKWTGLQNGISNLREAWIDSHVARDERSANRDHLLVGIAGRVW